MPELAQAPIRHRTNGIPGRSVEHRRATTQVAVPAVQIAAIYALAVADIRVPYGSTRPGYDPSAGHLLHIGVRGTLLSFFDSRIGHAARKGGNCR